MKIEPLLNNSQNNTSNRKEIEKAAKEFESFFTYYLLKVMRESVPKSGLLNSGMSESVYTSIIDENIADGIASRGGLGLSGFLIKQMESKLKDNK